MSGSRVYIGRLPRDTRQSDLERLFRKLGDIREVNLKSGFGFVEFKSSRDARDAVYEYDGSKFLGERIIVELARGPRREMRDERRGGGRGSRRRSTSRYRLVVDNIAPGTNWQDLKDLMRKAGEILYADVDNPRPGQGVVDFETRDDMEYALKKMDDRELNGQRIKLSRHQREDRRGDSRSRSRSRSPRSRSPRSRSRSPRSRSRSPPRRSSRRDRSRSVSASRSRSRSPRSARSRSRSPPSPRSPRSRSRSPSADGRRSASPASQRGSPRPDASDRD
ncbi:hypothetical protein BC940DRAFT_289467 [Gongronella butleri]|nr:hypothetical protein BC940DRAFT_289467 [Gongronella butleri]